MPRAFKPSPDHPAVAHLVQLHAELGGRRIASLQEAEQCADAMKHVEAVIKICDPAFDVHSIAVRRRNQTNPWFKRGHMLRTILDVLRAATEPLTAREIAERMLIARGIARPAGKDVTRLEASVRDIVFRGSLSKHVIADAGKPARWRLIL